MKRIEILLGMPLLSLLPFATCTGEKPITNWRGQGTKVIKARGSTAQAALRRVLPPPLTTKQKLQIATNAGLIVKLIQTDFKLSPQKPCALPNADIAFKNALLVSPGGDYADMGFGQGKIFFHFRPPVQGQWYLIDWCVKTPDTDMFQMSIKSAVVQQVTLPGKWDAQHITFILEPQSQGDFEFQLVCPNQNASNTWEFYFVEASVLK